MQKYYIVEIKSKKYPEANPVYTIGYFSTLTNLTVEAEREIVDKVVSKYKKHLYASNACEINKETYDELGGEIRVSQATFNMNWHIRDCKIRRRKTFFANLKKTLTQKMFSENAI